MYQHNRELEKGGILLQATMLILMQVARLGYKGTGAACTKGTQASNTPCVLLTKHSS